MKKLTSSRAVRNRVAAGISYVAQILHVSSIAPRLPTPWDN
jgi:hypothetical protein